MTDNYKGSDVKISVDGMDEIELCEISGGVVGDGFIGTLAKDLFDKDGKLLAREGDAVIADDDGGHTIRTTVTAP